MQVNVNGYLSTMPEGRIKVEVPKSWLPVYVCPQTFEMIAKTVLPPEGCDFDWHHMPTWAIVNPYQFVALFLFKDELEALHFKLKYL